MAAIGGFFADALGGMDALLHGLLFMVIIDYCTGILKALYLKRLSSAIGFKGIIKKVLIFVVVTVAVAMETLLVTYVPGMDILPMREMVIMFYIANEGLSLLENAGEVLPLPNQLKKFFIQIREETDNMEEGKSNE